MGVKKYTSSRRKPAGCFFEGYVKACILRNFITDYEVPQ